MQNFAYMMQVRYSPQPYFFTRLLTCQFPLQICRERYWTKSIFPYLPFQLSCWSWVLGPRSCEWEPLKDIKSHLLWLVGVSGRAQFCDFELESFVYPSIIAIRGCLVCVTCDNTVDTSDIAVGHVRSLTIVFFSIGNCLVVSSVPKDDEFFF